MKRVKVLGPSNDTGVPEVEFNLAKIVQNAKAHGLKWTKHTLYRTKGNHRPTEYVGNAVSCCALGASLLANDTKYLSIDTAANDTDYTHITRELYDAEALGLGFRLAMR